MVEGAWRLLHIKSQPPLTHFTAAMMASSVTVDTGRAREELGYVPVISVADGLAAMRGA